MRGCAVAPAKLVRLRLAHMDENPLHCESGPNKVTVHLYKVTVIVRNNSGLFIKNGLYNIKNVFLFYCNLYLII